MAQDVSDWLVQRRRVAAYERDERRAATVEQRLAALARLMASVDALGQREALEEDDAAIWARWQTLRRRLCRT